MSSFPLAALILDTASRANENPLSDGGKWTNPLKSGNGNLQLSSNHIQITSLACSAYWNPQTFGPNCEVFATVVAKPAAAANGELHLRVQNAGTTSLNSYFVDLSSTNASRILKTVNNVITNLGSGSATGIVAGDAIGLQVIGTSLISWFNHNGWNSIVSITDSSVSGVGNVGIAIGNASTPTFSNFSGGTIGPGPLIAPRRQYGSDRNIEFFDFRVT